MSDDTQAAPVVATADNSTVLGVLKLVTVDAEVHNRLFAASVTAGPVEAKSLRSQGELTAQTASISGSTTTGPLTVSGDVSAGSARLSRDVTADQVFARNLVTEHLRSSASMRTEQLSAAVLTDARLRGTIAESLRGTKLDAQTTAVVCSANAVTVTDPAARIVVDPTAFLASSEHEATAAARKPIEEPPPPPPRPTSQPVAPRIALHHEFGAGRDRLVLNHLGRYQGGVRVVGDLQVDGAILESSSASRKGDVEQLSADAAVDALADLEPISYRYLDDPAGVRHLGFIAEDVPELVAQPSRDRIRTMDVVALLTKVVKEQQQTIDSLAARVDALGAPAVTSRR